VYIIIFVESNGAKVDNQKSTKIALLKEKYIGNR